MPSAIDREGDRDTSPLKVPESEKVEEIITPEVVPIKATSEEHKHNYVPIWMPVMAFALIAVAYVYCEVTGTPVNQLRAIGVLGISGLFAIAAVYLDEKKKD